MFRNRHGAAPSRVESWRSEARSAENTREETRHDRCHGKVHRPGKHCRLTTNSLHFPADIIADVISSELSRRRQPGELRRYARTRSRSLTPEDEIAQG